MNDLVHCLELDRGELTEGPLAAPAVVCAFDPKTIASRSSSLVFQRCRFNTLCCRSAKNDSMAALSAQAPVRPIEPTRPLVLSRRTNFPDRNWLPRSECTTVPPGDRSAMAFRSAATASEAFIPGVADDATGEGVLHRAQVPLALDRGVLGDIGVPQ